MTSRAACCPCWLMLNAYSFVSSCIQLCLVTARRHGKRQKTFPVRERAVSVPHAVLCPMLCSVVPPEVHVFTAQLSYVRSNFLKNLEGGDAQKRFLYLQPPNTPRFRSLACLLPKDRRADLERDPSRAFVPLACCIPPPRRRPPSHCLDNSSRAPLTGTFPRSARLCRFKINQQRAAPAEEDGRHAPVGRRRSTLG